MVKTLKIFLIFLFVSTLGKLSNAGVWEVTGGKDFEDCHFRFSGPIQRGDLTRYLTELEKGPSWNPRVCLNSEGGSLSEVYDFIKQIRESSNIAGIATRVEHNAVCLSSCALLFMFGQGFGANSPYPSREIEPGGKLGFHSPFIAPKQTENVDASEAFHVALQVSKLLVDFSYAALTTSGPAVPPELVAIVLGTPGGNMHYVESVGELSILGITKLIDPEENFVIANDTGLISEAAKRICASSHVFTNRRFFVKNGYTFTDLSETIDLLMANEARVHHMKLKAAQGHRPARIFVMLSGTYSVPMWLSAGATLFCQVEFDVELLPEDFRVLDYSVGFGGPQFDWDSRLATQDDLRYVGERVGLIPVTQKYYQFSR